MKSYSVLPLLLAVIIIQVKGGIIYEEPIRGRTNVEKVTKVEQVSSKGVGFGGFGNNEHNLEKVTTVEQFSTLHGGLSGALKEDPANAEKITAVELDSTADGANVGEASIDGTTRDQIAIEEENSATNGGLGLSGALKEDPAIAEKITTVELDSTADDANLGEASIDGATGEQIASEDESSALNGGLDGPIYDATTITTGEEIPTTPGTDAIPAEDGVAVDKNTTIEVISTADGEAAIAEESSTTNEAYVINCLYERPDCFCLDYEEPVCSINGCTYLNDCRRVCAEVELAYAGPCRDHLDDLEDDE